MTDFFAMGGYAAYVWPAYILAGVIVVWLLAATLQGLRAHEATLKALEGTRPTRRRARRDAAPAATPVVEAGEA